MIFIERYQRILENMEDDDPVKMEFIGLHSSQINIHSQITVTIKNIVI